MNHFSDRLAEAIRLKGSPLCVGIDPRWDFLPLAIREKYGHDSPEAIASGIQDFSLRVLDLVAGKVAVIKPQSAFFELCGPAGMRSLQTLIQRARELGLIVVLDSKRGDIASTATAYADAAFSGLKIGSVRHAIWDADAITINPYLGRDACEPFIESSRSSGRGVFVLVRTSNPGSGLFQELECQGKQLYHHVADAVRDWNAPSIGDCGLGDVGAVVGATHPAELLELRERMPNVWLLVPGYGSQGGTAEDVRAGLRPDGLGAIINSSRGITFPYHPENPGWEKAIIAACDRSIHELRYHK